MVDMKVNEVVENTEN